MYSTVLKYTQPSSSSSSMSSMPSLKDVGLIVDLRPGLLIYQWSDHKKQGLETAHFLTISWLPGSKWKIRSPSCCLSMVIELMTLLQLKPFATSFYGYKMLSRGYHSINGMAYCLIDFGHNCHHCGVVSSNCRPRTAGTNHDFSMYKSWLKTVSQSYGLPSGKQT